MEFLDGEFRKEEEAIKGLQAETGHKAGENEVFVPEGPFIMGSYEYKDERPVRLVQDVGGLYIDKFPVTNEDFCRFLNVKPDDVELENWIVLGQVFMSQTCMIKKDNRGFKVEPRFEKYPVTFVTLRGVVDYAHWAGKRIPTEKEWEKAARGCLGRRYSWGHEFGSSFCNTEESGIEKTTPVTKYLKGRSPYGCFDMAEILSHRWISFYTGQKRLTRIFTGHG